MKNLERTGIPVNIRQEENPQGKFIVVSVGINQYENWQKLNNAVNDALEFQQVMIDKLGFTAPIEPLINEKATKDAIENLVQEKLRDIVKEDDNLIIFFAGHGHTRTESDAGYIVPFEARSPNPKEYWGDYIRLNFWLQEISELSARHILVILDACHSGFALGNEIQRFRNVETYQEDLNNKKSRKVIASARSNQPALDGGSIPNHSLFTGILINGFVHGEADLDHNGLITSLELGLYVQQKVGQASESQQTPDFGSFGSDARGEMVIALQNKVNYQRFHVPKFYPDNSYPKPDVLIDRQEKMQQVINSVFENQCTVLWGGAGYGKTCLAWLLCFREEIVKHFKGGIFWLNLNEINELSEVYKKLFSQLTGIDRDLDKLEKLNQKINSLKPTEVAEILGDKIRQEWSQNYQLIVLDNATDRNLTEDIIQLGTEACYWLVTTRNEFLILNNTITQKKIELNDKNFKFEECITLLTYDLSRDNQLDNLDMQKIIKLASILYKYPPLFQLAREKIIIDCQSNKELENQEEKLSFGEILDETIEAFSELSLEMLDEEETVINAIKKDILLLNQEELEKLQSLCVFPTDQNIPFSILNKYWETKNTYTRHLCEKLHSQSLIENISRKKKTIRISSLIKKYFLLSNTIKKKIPYFHQKLIKKYQNFDFGKLAPNPNSSLTTEEINYLKMNGSYHLLNAKP